MARSTVPASEAIRLQPPSEFTSAEEYFPPRMTLTGLRTAASRCKACDLWLTGTRTVFGEGLKSSEVVFIGEQPGDREDLAGKPFVGPSGRLLDEALENAGIDRSKVYVTNAVKHFKWERATIRRARPGIDEKRLHKSPNTAEGRACQPWLWAELRVLRPEIIVVLGSFAAKMLMGSSFKVTKQRGKPLAPGSAFMAELRGANAPTVFVTVHPSAVLRAPSPEDRAKARRAFFADLEKVGRYLRTAR
jgi:uracil-DNA glycosylase